jgi:O-antigen/teichoic acid export membrane protein
MNRPEDRLAERGSAEKSLSGTVLSGGKWLGMAALAQALLQIVIVAVLARLLSPAEFGLAAVAGIFIDLAAGIAAMGASRALVQRRELTRYHIRAAFWISMVMGLSVTMVLYFSSTFLAAVLHSLAAAPLIAALSSIFAIRALGSVPEGLATRRLNFRLLAICKVAAYLLGYGAVGIVSAHLGAGAWALVYAQIAQVSLGALLLIAPIRFDWRPTMAWTAYREILGYGSGSSVATIVNSLATQVDQAIVSMNTNTVAVGLYTRAVQVTRYPSRLVGRITEDVLFPSFAGVQTDRERLARAYYRSIASICVVMTPVSVFFCLTAGPITDLLLGPQWEGVVPLIAAFGVSILFRSTQRVNSALLLAVGRSWLIAALQLLFLVTNTIGALIGIRFGLLGAAIGVTASFVLYYLALTIACMLVLSLDVGRLLACHFAGLPLTVLAASGAGIGAAAAAAGLLPSLVSLVLSALISTALALAAIVARPRFFLRGDGQWLASLLLSKLPRKWRASSLVSALAGSIAR